MAFEAAKTAMEKTPKKWTRREDDRRKNRQIPKQKSDKLTIRPITANVLSQGDPSESHHALKDDGNGMSVEKHSTKKAAEMNTSASEMTPGDSLASWLASQVPQELRGNRTDDIEIIEHAVEERIRQFKAAQRQSKAARTKSNGHKGRR